MAVEDLLFSVLQSQENPAFVFAIADRMSLCSSKTVWVNPAFDKLLRRSTEIFLNQSPSLFLSEETAGFLEQCIKENGTGTFHLRNAQIIQGAGNSALSFDFEVTVPAWDSSENTYVYCRFVDVTEREELQARLEVAESEIKTLKSRFEHALNSIPEGFAMYDRDDILVAFNSKYAELYKHTAPAIKVGASFETIMRYGLENGQYPEAEGQEEDWLAERLDRENRKRAPVERRLPGGKFLRIQEVENENGDLVGLRSDVTQYYEQQQELEQKAEELAKANAETKAASLAKERFFARMSHELRTPMNGILGITEVLQHSALNSQQRSYLKTISGSASSLLSIINEILDYSKATEGKFTLDNKRFSLKDTIYEAGGLIQPLAHDRGLDFWIEYPHAVPSHFFGDGARIRQVLLNLLGNALKFTRKGHFGLRAVYADVDGQDRLLLSVVDTGCGIREDQIGSLFSAYEQTHQDHENAVEGTGLGLAISKALVEQMGGTIDVTSCIGRGSCFTVSLDLPVCPTSAQKAGDRNDLAHRHNVAIVGPHIESNTVLKRTLESMNCRVCVFESTHEIQSAVDQFYAVIWDGDRIECLEAPPRTALSKYSDNSIHALMLSTPQRHSTSEETSIDLPVTWLKPVRREEIAHALFPAIGPVSDCSSTNEMTASSDLDKCKTCKERILVVDDNKTNRLVAGKLLESIGVIVDFACNGLEALDLYKALRPTTIFMDVTMPVMDGIDAMSHIRKLELELGLAPCKIFALTANTHKTQVELCLQSGADGVLGKPVKRSDLVEAINLP